jgi:CRISPR/Cas system-associated endonuclease Cas1
VLKLRRDSYSALRVDEPPTVEQIRVTQREGKHRRVRVLADLPVREVEQVVLCGNILLTTQAAALLLSNNVVIVFLSVFGRDRRRLTRDGSKHAHLRHAQLNFVVYCLV